MMSHQLGNDEGSSAPGSFLDFRPNAGENEERPPSGDPTGQVNQSFGKFINSVNFTCQTFNDDCEFHQRYMIMIRYSSGQSFQCLLFQPAMILLNEKNNKLY